MSTKRSLHIEAKCNPDEVRRAAEIAEDFAQGEDWPLKVVFQVKLALEEVMMNIVSYAHEDSDNHQIDLDLVSDAEALTIEISDDGQPFDPLTDAPSPDLQASLEDRHVGGLGVHLVRTMMDEVHYRRERDRNLLTLVKQRDG